MGSIPFGLILTKFFLKKDIREVGSGNIGATNVLRTGNKVIGYLTLILDISKAVIPVFYIKFNFPELELVYISSLSVFVGHVFPVWLKFKGGKGVATYIGFLFGADYILGIIFISAWLIIASITKYSSLSSISSLLIIPLIIILFFSFNIQVIYLFFGISGLIIFKHYKNILRLFDKTESKIRF